jgi:6-pyruvoyltetrahydropterin/6-carboxytetrahydropterin synthase
MVSPRYTVSKELDFSAAHFLRDYGGKCEALHGHNYRVRVTVAADELDGAGLVVDFAKLKAAMQEVIAPFDHACLNEVPPFDKLNPSLENVARYICEEMAQRIDDDRVRVTECRLSETERNRAIYRR